MHKRICAFLLPVAMVLFFGNSAQAESEPEVAMSSSANAARLVKFGGALKDHGGAPLSGTVGLSIAIYKEPQGGTPLWMETQNVVLDAQGNYSLLLGATLSEGLPPELFATGESRWLGIQAQLPGEVEQPRVLLVGVPYALKAADADMLGGKPLSAFVLAGPDNTGAQAAASIDSGKKIVDRVAAAVSGAAAALPVTTNGGTVNSLTKWLDTTGTLVDSAVFESNGNVGMGTANPGSLMELFNVAPNLRLRGTFVQNGNFGNTFTPPLQTDVLAALGQYTGSGGGVLYGFSGSDASIPGVTLDGYMGTNTPSAPAVLITGTKPNGANNNVALGSTEKLLQVVNNLGPGLLTVLGGGNVGVGTATPGFKLDVQGGQINASGGLCMAGTCQTNWNSFSGLATFSALPSGSGVGQGSLYVNPPSAGAGQTLFGVAVGGSPKLVVDNLGDVTASGNITAPTISASTNNGINVSSAFGTINTAIAASNTTPNSANAIGAIAGQISTTQNNAVAVAGVSNGTTGQGVGMFGATLSPNGAGGVFANRNSTGQSLVATIGPNDDNVFGVQGDGAGGDARVGIGNGENFGLAKLTLKATAPFTGTGTMSVTSGSNVVTGTGTNFSAELGPGDRITLGSTNEIYTVASINSNTSLNLTFNVITTAPSSTFTVNSAYFRLDDSNFTGRMVITNPGPGSTPMVGIGTLVPSNVLDVAGRSTFRNRVVISGGSAGQKPSMLTSRGSAFSSIGGTVQVASGSTAVTGTGTGFLSNLGLGDRIVIGVSNEIRTIISITDNTHLTVDSNFNTTETGVTLMAAPGLFRADVANGNTAVIINDQGNLGVGTLLPGREVEVNGGVRLNTVNAQPTCDGTQRGTFWVTQGGAGVKDSVQVCAKDAGDAYAWRTLY